MASKRYTKGAKTLGVSFLGPGTGKKMERRSCRPSVRIGHIGRTKNGPPATTSNPRKRKDCKVLRGKKGRERRGTARLRMGKVRGTF